MWKSIFFVQIDMAEPVEIGELDEPRGDRHQTKRSVLLVEIPKRVWRTFRALSGGAVFLVLFDKVRA